MIKRLLYLFVLIAVLGVACKNKEGGRRLWNRATNGQEGPSPRDYSVTKENAYNDLFLDSAAFEKFIAANVSGDSITANLRDFYNIRNFEFAWFDSKGLTEQALGFRSLYKYATDSADKKVDRQMDDLLLHETTIDPADPTIVKIELELSKRFVRYSLDTYKDADIDDRSFETFVPIKKVSALALADSILARKNKDNTQYAASNSYYNGLKEQLAKFVAIQKKGGWDTVSFLSKTKYAPGKSFPEILSYKKRLNASGELAAIDTTDIFTPELETAIKDYQTANGITPDGKITTPLVKSLNISAMKRVEQILVNMERMRWMPTKKEGKLILVNIPEFTLHVTEGDNHVIHMPVVVGKEGHTTTMFSDDLELIVFSPYWNIPPSIVKNEILPSISKNKNYLKENNMEVVSGGNIPEVRQLPGPKNSLGLVKFLFPNSFNIYFHDTPAKSLFEKDNRAASHGCIRLADPVKMANYLLQDSPEWTPEKIDAAMHAGVEKTVKLKHSVPVIITYYTAWVDENKKMNFREDIYGNDGNIAAKMFSN
jgi:murein L,D-transpeptidase YcbB/YkuD